MKKIITIFLVLLSVNSYSQELTGDLERDIKNVDIFSSSIDYRSTEAKLVGLGLGLGYVINAHFLEPDKFKHQIGEIYATGTTYAVVYGTSGGDRYKARIWALSVGGGLGLGKEIYDVLKPEPTGFNVGDLLISWVSCFVSTVASDLLFSK